MAQPEYDPQRHAALQSVRQDYVRFHYGLSGPALGYTWSENAGGQMTKNTQWKLHELFSRNLIEVDSQRLFAQRGCRVIMTQEGCQVLASWDTTVRSGNSA